MSTPKDDAKRTERASRDRREEESIPGPDGIHAVTSSIEAKSNLSIMWILGGSHRIETAVAPGGGVSLTLIVEAHPEREMTRASNPSAARHGGP